MQRQMSTALLEVDPVGWTHARRHPAYPSQAGRRGRSCPWESVSRSNGRCRQSTGGRWQTERTDGEGRIGRGDEAFVAYYCEPGCARLVRVVVVAVTSSSGVGGEDADSGQSRLWSVPGGGGDQLETGRPRGARVAP